MKKGLLLIVTLVLGMAPGAWAQLNTGNIYGVVSDESGALMPGSTVTISGATLGARSTVSGSTGDFRFLALDPGRYKLVVSLTGFTTVNREVVVATGGNVNLTFNLKVASVEETVTVTAETPVVDSKKVGTSTMFSQEELTLIPNARDPWGLMRSVPGVLVDRVNIAGNESGQQANWVGKGSASKDNTFNVDGVSITDLAATGASPTYYDQDAFEEISINTGGSDLKIMTGGVGVNFVTKRGTNKFKGTLRGYYTHDDFQSGNLPDEVSPTDPRLKNPDGSYRDRADHIQQISDYGLDVGGPIVKDKLWFWGSYGKQDIRLTRFSGTADKTILKDYNAKINWQASSNDMISGFWFLGAKSKFGRSPGSGLLETDGVLFDQGGAYPNDNFKGLWKFEWNHVFSPNFFLNAKAAYYGTGFGFEPHGGRTTQYQLNYVTGVASGSSFFYQSLRPQKTGQVDASYFASGMGGNHELKFGFFYRKASVASSSGYGGTKAKVNGAGADVAQLQRDANTLQEGKSYAGYIGDTFTKDRLTVNLGVRYDHQETNNGASAVPANSLFPDLLPALDFAGGGTGIEWNTISPRVGLTYALDESRRTIVRAAYARYAGQVPLAQPSNENPVASSYIAYGWNDTNADGLVQTGEVLVGAGPLYYSNVDPANPGAVGSSVNKIDPDFKANVDHEFIVGIDREMAPNLAVSVAYTYRKATDIAFRQRIGVTNYTQNAPITASGFTAFTFSPDAAQVGASGGGRLTTNKPGYNRSYNGLEFAMTKRLSNKWMSRVTFAYNDWVDHYSELTGNPTQTISYGATDLAPNIDGGQVSLLGGGSGKSNFFSSAKWTLSANAMYQLPAGFEISGALFGRQGYPLPISLRIPAGRDGNIEPIALDAIDAERQADLWNLDLRLAKNLKLGGTNLVLSAEGFNILNAGTVLSNFRQATSSAFRRVDEILNPRVFRFGVRYTF